MMFRRSSSRPSQAARLIVDRIAPLGANPVPTVEEVQHELERPCCFVYLQELEIRWGVDLEDARQLVIDEMTITPRLVNA